MLNISIEEANAIVKPELDEFKSRARLYYSEESDLYTHLGHERQVKIVDAIVNKAYESGITYESDVLMFGELYLESLENADVWIQRQDVRAILDNIKLPSGVKILQLYSLDED